MSKEVSRDSLARRLGLFDATMIVMGGIIGALIFANHIYELVGVRTTDLRAALLASIGLAALTIINCIGVRAGSMTQNVLMILKLVAIAALVAVGLTVSGPTPALGAQATNSSPTTWQLLTAFGAALIPAQFAYGGWQTACFVAGEVREPRKNLPRGLLLGVLGVIVVYLSVNYVCVHALGADRLAATKTPASAVMYLALGSKGARFIAAGIAISTIGFLSQSMLTAPRVYFAMADDGLFFKQLAWLNRARVPAFAIALQGALAIVIALIASHYEQILNYVVSVDVVFFALTAACVFLFRKQGRKPTVRQSAALGISNDTLPDGRVSVADTFRIPGHPFTTLFFIAACGVITFSLIYKFPLNSAISFGIMLLGVPAYFVWAGQKPDR